MLAAHLEGVVTNGPSQACNKLLYVAGSISVFPRGNLPGIHFGGIHNIDIVSAGRGDLEYCTGHCGWDKLSCRKFFSMGEGGSVAGQLGLTG